MHTRALLKQGEPIEKLALVQAWKEAGSLFDDREKAGLAWAETVTRVAETGVPDDAYEAARNVFDDRELNDLTIDRKSGGAGKKVTVLVDRGGRGIRKQK